MSVQKLEDPPTDLVLQLFWDIWDMRLDATLRDKDAQILSSHSDLLEWWEPKARVSYEPDVTDWDAPGQQAKLIIYTHLGAARALALKRKVGYNEDVVDCLERACWAGRLVFKGDGLTAEEVARELAGRHLAPEKIERVSRYEPAD